MSIPALTRPRRKHDQGQVLVLVALSFVLLLGMAGVAIDAGRFLTQRRFLQNAADAAALAAANTVVQRSSATVATVEQAARDNLAINLAGSAVGAPIVVVPASPFFGGLPALGPNLVNGIVLTSADGTPLAPGDGADRITDIRVALR
ncbi:MAG TPA: pilus assembly protein TadG-related protein, partial [Candidatus Limnocylindrales bacterium]|nr:pilus assembly protein TadG-related protein [Candidatus Limnocylindrales bacterium]